MRQPARARPRRGASRERADGGRAAARHLPRHAAAVRALGRARGRARARPAARRRDARSTAPASCRTSAGTSSRFERASRADRRASATPRPSTTCTRSPAAPVRRRRRASARRVRRALRRRSSSATTSSACSSTPRSPRATGCALLRNFAGVCARSPRMILYPAIDILDGKAVRLVAGPTSRTRPSTTTTRSRPRASWVEARRALPARRRPRRRARRRAGVARAPARGSSRETGRAGPVRRRAAHARRRSATALRGRRRARDRRHGRASATSTSSTTCVAALRRRACVVSVDVRGGHDLHRGLDADDRRCRPRDAIRAPAATAACARSSTPTSTATAMLDGPGPRRGRARSPRPCAGASSTPAGSATLERPAARCAALRQVNLAGVIVGKALYERRFTVAEARTALRRTLAASRSAETPAALTTPSGCG